MNSLRPSEVSTSFEFKDVEEQQWKVRINEGRIFEYAPDAMLVVDESGHILIGNARAEAMFDSRQLEAGKLKASILFPEWDWMLPEGVGGAKQNLERTITVRSLKKDGREDFTAELSYSVMPVNDRKFLIVTVRDVGRRCDEKYQLETTLQQLQVDNAHLESLVKTDSLTDLLNRRGLEGVLVREIEYARRNQTELLAALLDLDDFKKVNDTRGHFTGDLVLKHVARILRNTTRAIDWVGRVGGDEFLILLPCTTLMSGAKVAERVRHELCNNSVSTVEGDIRQTASLGLVSLPTTVCSIEEVLELTKATLKYSKRRGKNCVSFGEQEYTDFKEQSLSVIELMRDSNSYRALSQPILRLNGREVVGYELTTRGPAGHLEMPDDFFRVARDSNMLTLVDLHCLKVSIERMQTIPDDKICHVNIFPSTLNDVPVEKLIEQLRQTGDRRKLCVELSEKRIIAEPYYLVQAVRALKASGIMIALDEVGFGYTSLETLLLLEPDIVKIDGRLTLGIAHHSDNQIVVKRLAAIADTINATTIAQGIECKEDFVCMQKLGVKCGQGWYLSRPE